MPVKIREIDFFEDGREQDYQLDHQGEFRLSQGEYFYYEYETVADYLRGRLEENPRLEYCPSVESAILCEDFPSGKALVFYDQELQRYYLEWAVSDDGSLSGLPDPLRELVEWHADETKTIPRIEDCNESNVRIRLTSQTGFPIFSASYYCSRREKEWYLSDLYVHENLKRHLQVDKI